MNNKSRNEMAERLIAALRGGQFVLFGQTIGSLQPERVERPFREVLIRHLEEEEKMLPPGEFFPILEEQGLLGLLDRWVINEVLRISPTSGAGRPRNSINLSSDSISNPEFAHFVSKRVKQYSAEADVLCFEVTETEAVANLSHLRQLIAALGPTGCTFAVSGYTGTNAKVDLLRELSLQYLKIDGGLIRKLLVSRDVLAQVKLTLQRCQELGVLTVAELVEEPHTLAALAKLGVDFAQGYHVSKPAQITRK